MGEEKRDCMFTAGAHISLIKISTKGFELFYEVTVLYSMCSFSPDITLGLVLTGHSLNELFMVP